MAALGRCGPRSQAVGPARSGPPPALPSTALRRPPIRCGPRRAGTLSLDVALLRVVTSPSAAVRRLRTVSGFDRVLRRVSRPRLRPLPPLPPGARSVLLYSPSNLNQVDGSAIWVRSVVDTLLVDPAVTVTLPLRAPIRRDVITGPLRELDRVEVVDPHPRLAARNLGLSTTQALDLIERLDDMRPFDAILLRSFALCQRAVERPRLAGTDLELLHPRTGARSGRPGLPIRDDPDRGALEARRRPVRGDAGSARDRRPGGPRPDGPAAAGDPVRRARPGRYERTGEATASTRASSTRSIPSSG